MAVSASLAELQAEASCPICLGYLKDPVTTHCGHNFCHSCIHQCWEDLQDIFPCPVCLHHCPEENLRSNTQFRHMTDVVQQLPDMRRKRKRQEEEEPLCGKHCLRLALFCEKDLELLCPQCRVSSDHQHHPLLPIEEAAARNRRKLKSYIQPLKEKIEDAKMQREATMLKSVNVKRMMEAWRKELQSEFEEIKISLVKKQAEICASLLVEENDAEEKLTANQREISDHLFLLQNLLNAVTEKCFQGDLDVLTGAENIYNTYDNLKAPAVFSPEFRKKSLGLPPHYFGLQRMMSTFQEDLTLDPETAHPSLIISGDRKSVVFSRLNAGSTDNPQSFCSYRAVRSCEGFDAGRHFWHVEVRGTGALSLGVCKETFPRDGLTSPTPQMGCWEIQPFCSSCSTRNTEVLQMGIFLDYELGEVSFYNLNTRSHVYTFTDKFTEKLMPYFSVDPSSQAVTISVVIDQ
ncbi:hypothetical protein P7K49_007068 [Saguinus oedipus]|uniref:Tripartite motif-containing protein 5 n=1 Tax=Saguinus oedipus TaxID=9490 RepID=A0ABQ9W465_SAGOE|nr:hypothetical protein P7K49_007068 [Saguinus oedipus]